jgi:hypothetical protein
MELHMKKNSKVRTPFLDLINERGLPEMVLLSMAEQIAEWHRDKAQNIGDLIFLSLVMETRLRALATIIKMPCLN